MPFASVGAVEKPGFEDALRSVNRVLYIPAIKQLICPDHFIYGESNTVAHTAIKINSTWRLP